MLQSRDVGLPRLRAEGAARLAFSDLSAVDRDAPHVPAVCTHHCEWQKPGSRLREAELSLQRRKKKALKMVGKRTRARRFTKTLRTLSNPQLSTATRQSHKCRLLPPHLFNPTPSRCCLHLPSPFARVLMRSRLVDHAGRGAETRATAPLHAGAGRRSSLEPNRPVMRTQNFW